MRATTRRAHGRLILAATSAISVLVVLATLALVLIGTGPAGAETPAERCARETSAYNAAWATSWAAANPGRPPSQAPPPPVPYVCTEPQEPTTTSPAPTTAPGLPEPGEQGAGPNVGAHAPTDIPAPGATPIVPARPSTPARTSVPALPAQPIPPPQSATPQRSSAAAVPRESPNQSPTITGPTTTADTVGDAVPADNSPVTGGDTRSNLIPTSVWVLVGAAAVTAGALSVRKRPASFGSRRAVGYAPASAPLPSTGGAGQRGSELGQSPPPPAQSPSPKPAPPAEPAPVPAAPSTLPPAVDPTPIPEQEPPTVEPATPSLPVQSPPGEGPNDGGEPPRAAPVFAPGLLIPLIPGIVRIVPQIPRIVGPGLRLLPSIANMLPPLFPMPGGGGLTDEERLRQWMQFYEQNKAMLDSILRGILEVLTPEELEQLQRAIDAQREQILRDIDAITDDPVLRQQLRDLLDNLERITEEEERRRQGRPISPTDPTPPEVGDPDPAPTEPGEPGQPRPNQPTTPGDVPGTSPEQQPEEPSLPGDLPPADQPSAPGDLPADEPSAPQVPPAELPRPAAPPSNEPAPPPVQAPSGDPTKTPDPSDLPDPTDIPEHIPELNPDEYLRLIAQTIVAIIRAATDPDTPPTGDAPAQIDWPSLDGPLDPNFIPINVPTWLDLPDTPFPPVNWWGLTYPIYDDPRTGLPIPAFPPDMPQLPPNLRTPRGEPYRAQFIREWIQRGYPLPIPLTPGGDPFEGWEVHHILPLEYGGNHAFENLIILPKDLHYLYTQWWRYYAKP